MSTDFIFRLLGMVVFTVLGMVLGQQLGQAANVNPVPGTLNIEQYTFTIGLVGALTGLVLTPYFTTRPARFLRDLFKRVSAQTLFSALVARSVGCSWQPCLPIRSRCFPNRLATFCHS